MLSTAVLKGAQSHKTALLSTLAKTETQA